MSCGELLVACRVAEVVVCAACGMSCCRGGCWLLLACRVAEVVVGSELEVRVTAASPWRHCIVNSVVGDVQGPQRRVCMNPDEPDKLTVVDLGVLEFRLLRERHAKALPLPTRYAKPVEPVFTRRITREPVRGVV